jgi:hypothetical protein
MKLLSPAISALARLRLPRIENWTSHPVEAQRDVLQHLVTSAQYTFFGKKHDFSRLFTIRDFKAKVPLHEYDDLKPCIQRMLDGEDNVLWNSPVHWFAKSSGTTSDKSKFIPVSEESLRQNHYEASKDVLTMYYKNFPSSDLLTGKSLVVGGSHQISRLNEEIQFGDLSAVLMQNSPFWGQWLRTPELSIALLDEWEEKIEKLAQSTANENVTSLAGVPTWTLLLLKRILEIKGKSVIADVWPSLELYIHGGVSFIPYRDQFEKIIGKPVNYLEIYNASEGFFAGQDAPGTDGMLLFTGHGIFYEFMPVGEYGKSTPRTIGLRDVNLQDHYALVISTTGGLWRYIVGDTIQFTSLYPFRIRVTGRIRHYMNAFGEEVMVENTDRAIAAAAAATASGVGDYTAAPLFYEKDGIGAHEWLIEFERAPDDINLFSRELDSALKKLNSDYEAKRQKDMALKPPVVHVLEAGSFNRWLKSKGKMGGQHKVPRLSNGREIIEEIKSFLSDKQST